MHMFKIIAADGATLTVCAEDYDAAAGVFVIWHLATHGTQPGAFEVLKRNRRWQGLNRAHVDAALARGITGVATYDPAEGWTVTPPAMPEG
jgi:hypothetical protein